MEKSRNAHGAPVAHQRTPAPTRFLTAVFVVLTLIAGLDTIAPSLKLRLIPESGSQPRAGAARSSNAFDWSQVRY